MCCKTLFEPGWLPIGSIGHSHGYPPSKLGSGAIAPWCGSTSRRTMVGPPRRRGPIVQARMRRFFTRAASPRKSDGGGAPSLGGTTGAIAPSAFRVSGLLPGLTSALRRQEFYNNHAANN
jgi:hypothetical protein